MAASNTGSDVVMNSSATHAQDSSTHTQNSPTAGDTHAQTSPAVAAEGTQPSQTSNTELGPSAPVPERSPSGSSRHSKPDFEAADDVAAADSTLDKLSKDVADRLSMTAAPDAPVGVKAPLKEVKDDPEPKGTVKTSID